MNEIEAMVFATWIALHCRKREEVLLFRKAFAKRVQRQKAERLAFWMDWGDCVS